MLIDWELAGPDRRFQVKVPDVQEARSFYREVFGAEETFREANDSGDVVRLGLAIGKVQFVISSIDEIAEQPPLLSLLAADLREPYVAIILKVEDPDHIALIALKHGAKLADTPAPRTIAVVTDPFGSHWAFVKREPAAKGLISTSQRMNKGDLH